MNTLYAFCRVIDDIADSTTLSDQEKRTQLAAWEETIHSKKPAKALQHYQPLGSELLSNIGKFDINPHIVLTILTGVKSDIGRSCIQDFSELKEYCYQVACAVGLASIRIFGCQESASDDYAEQLGYFLQLTNIIRDVGEDIDDNGRVYLPQSELIAHNYSMDELQNKIENEQWQQLMLFQCLRAKSYREKAQSIFEKLSKKEQNKLLPAEIMASIYEKLLFKVEDSNYSVLSHRHKLSKAQKARIFLQKALF